MTPIFEPMHQGFEPTHQGFEQLQLLQYLDVEEHGDISRCEKQRASFQGLGVGYAVG